MNFLPARFLKSTILIKKYVYEVDYHRQKVVKVLSSLVVLSALSEEVFNVGYISKSVSVTTHTHKPA